MRRGPGALAWAVIFSTGCATLKPLPVSDAAPCGRTSVSVEDLWRCLRELGPAEKPESGFASTLRVVNGDMGRKKRDQVPSSACGGAVPEGFELIAGDETEPERAPLHALYRPADPGKAVVIVVHGLFDSKFSRYVLLTSEVLAAMGFGVLAPD